jgi:hypothetical protein
LTLVVLFISCNKKDSPEIPKNTGEFAWKQNLTVNDIPDSPIKGFLNGKEITFEYINFENWRGSGDNVINFSNKRPKQDCGFVENDDAFTLIKKAGEFTVGNFVKESFDSRVDGVSSDYHYYQEGKDIIKVDEQWNCALIITDINEKTVKGKIAICYNDKNKSWIAGTFEAVRCLN